MTDPGDAEIKLESQTNENLTLQKRWFTFLLTKKVPAIPDDEDRAEYPERKANIVSQTMFWWMNGLFYTGYKRTIAENDLWKLDEPQKVDTMYHTFKTVLDDCMQHHQDLHVSKKCQKRNETTENSSKCREEDLQDFKLPKRSLMYALWKALWFDYAFGMVMEVLSDTASALAPLLQKKLTAFVESRVLGTENNVGKGVGYAIGCSLLIFFSAVTINFALYRMMMTGGKVRNLLTRVLLEKSMQIDALGKHKFPASHVNTIMSTDLNRIDFGISVFSLVVSFPVPITIAIALLIVNIGVSALVGIGCFIILFLIIGLSFSTLVRLRETVTQFADKRVSLIKELLKNFKMIKFYSWESFYQKRIEETRNQEMQSVLKLQSLRNALIAIAFSLPSISSMCAFLVMYKITNGRSAASIFASLSLFEILATQFMLLPMAMATGADAKVGFERVTEYLSCSDYNKKDFEILPLEEHKNTENLSLKVINGAFEWPQFEDEESRDTDEENDTEEVKLKEISLTPLNTISDILVTGDSDSEPTNFKRFSGLKNINLEVKKGEFIVVTGSIGSGKSSLLNALAGFMKRVEGQIFASSDPLLCGYPWVKNATIRANILFGNPYDKKFYDEVINACSLPSDFKQFTGGDLTEVGERGITLSGGQKARINLARAVYANHEIILLDDVLSAVDAKVGKHIVENCILGLLKDKTRILATHQLSLIDAADRMIFMNGNGTIDVGTISDLKKDNEAFIQLFKYQENNAQTQEETEMSQADNNDITTENAKTEPLQVELLKTVTDRLEENEKEVYIIADEEKAVNSFGWSVYKHYLLSGFGIFGYAYLPLLLISLILSTFCNFFSNNWLAYWIEYKFKRPLSFYQGIYIMLTFLYTIFLCVYSTMMGYFTTTASRKLNIAATKRILKVPMAFMDVSPMGRVLNRFTKDTDVLDNEIVEQVRMATTPLATIVGTFILCIIYLPWFAIAVPCVLFTYIAITSYYQATSREIKRIDAVKRSFVYSHFNETLGGFDTIRAYHKSQDFLDEINKLMDEQNEAYYLTLAAQRWLGSNLALVTVGFVFLIAMLCCFRVFDISASATGLILAYAMNIPNLLSLALRGITQFENEFNSVERLNHYAYELVQEAPHEIPETAPPASWPENGSILFKDVCMKYRPELPYVLKNVNLSFKAHEKIGFCGRTGAGKSTFMTCLYRLTEFEGHIDIDGHDISKLGLHTLRSKLTIIPQDPVLFVGNIRSNLDPFDEHRDNELWNALVTAGLVKEYELSNVKAQSVDDENLHKFHLFRTVEDDGANFSVGERQLIALARALVRKTKILILDEATSSVDYETDSMIQKTIAAEFGDCTILSIAHRLKTILNYDKIVVMDKGEVVQFDAPLTLFEEENGIFRSMCEQSGISKKDFFDFSADNIVSP